MYSWLEYSPRADASFCFPCILYAETSSPYSSVYRYQKIENLNENVNLWTADLKKPSVSRRAACKATN